MIVCKRGSELAEHCVYNAEGTRGKLTTGHKREKKREKKRAREKERILLLLLLLKKI